MKILFLTTHYSLEAKHSWLVDTLAEVMAKDNEVAVLFFDWSGKYKTNEIVDRNGVKVYVVSTVSWFYRAGFGKALKWALIGRLFVLKNSRMLKDFDFDVVIGFTPALILSPIVSCLKKYKKNVRSYLVLWDFFPDYHYQLGLLSKTLYPFLSWAESAAYKKYDCIGMMSRRNIEYFKKRHGFQFNVEVLKLWGPDVSDSSNVGMKNIGSKRKLEGRLAVFGGQLIPGRGLDKVIDLARYALKKGYDVKFVIYGDGPERDSLLRAIEECELKNVIYKGFAPREEYMSVLESAHMGLVFNSGHVHVPTYPSKAIDFFRAAVPVLAYVEDATDFGEILQYEIRAGFSSSPSCADDLYRNFDRLMQMDNDQLLALGLNGYKYYKDNMTVSKAKDCILRAISECS